MTSDRTSDERLTERTGGLQERACLNCGAILSGPFCSQCGQQAHVHRTLTAFWHDLLHGVFHFEGKVWRTLPMLAWKPGELTRRYIEGERARFVSPLATFLFSVFLSFALIGSMGASAYRDPKAGAKSEHKLVGESPFDSVAILEQERSSERKENDRELEALQTARGRIIAAGRSSRIVDADIANLRREAVQEEEVFERAIALQRAWDRRAEAHKRPVEGVRIHPTGSTSSPKYLQGLNAIDRNPDLVFYKVQTNAYKYSWALIPLLIPFVWLLFASRRRYRQYTLYDHAVFVTYALSFFGLFAIAFTFLKLLGLHGSYSLLPLLVLPVHTYRHLKGSYSLSRLAAGWRAIALSFVFVLVGGLFFLGLLLLGALG